VQSAFGDGSVFVGYGVLGGSASGDDSMTISSSLKFNFTINDSTASEDLLVGLLCSNSTGSGFESLTFTISGENGTLFNETFQSFDLAEAFFNDNVLDFGILSGLVGDDLSSTLTFVLSLTASDASGYDFNFVYGAANSSPVPIPGAVWLFGSGLAVLTGMRRSRRG
ncbi:MAG: VPLPA-CTERM sorting domain-containing protein, partial [Syntrophobacteraceae bacterium]